MPSPRSNSPASPRARVVVGLLGGVAAGKSAAAAAFAACGAEVLDADDLAHAALAREDVREAIRARFGKGVVADDGSVDRAALARSVFSDASARAALEAILHPEVRRQITSRLEASSAPVVVLDVPLLLERGLLDACDVTLYVEASAERRRARASRSRGWSETEVDRREAAQSSLDEKRARADFVVDNEGSLEKLREQIRTILSRISPSLPTAPGPEGRGGG